MPGSPPWAKPSSWSTRLPTEHTSPETRDGPRTALHPRSGGLMNRRSTRIMAVAQPCPSSWRRTVTTTMPRPMRPKPPRQAQQHRPLRTPRTLVRQRRPTRPPPGTAPPPTTVRRRQEKLGPSRPTTAWTPTARTSPSRTRSSSARRCPCREVPPPARSRRSPTGSTPTLTIKIRHELSGSPGQARG